MPDQLGSPWGGPGLYLHLPFCARICPYCDFSVLKGGLPEQRRFVSQLRAEIEMVGAEADGSPWEGIDTLYLGGGTPSLLEPAALEELLAVAVGALPIRPDAWLFLEANPEDVGGERLAAWRRLGVRTVSLGVQAFDAPALGFLGRGHTPEMARRSVELARQSGFATVSVDLIYGLPGDHAERWRHSLEVAVELEPDHLSCYQLTIHEGTPFGFRAARGELRELAEEPQAELFRLTHLFLRDHGYVAYEVSSFARAPEHRSRHNRKYWQHLPYLGLGPSAHSFDGQRRWWNERKLGAYAARLARHERPIAGCEVVSSEQRVLEEVMLGLRTTDGIDLARFRGRHGFDLRERNSSLLARLVADGLLEQRTDALVPTLEGLAVADGLAADLDLTPLPAPHS
jgi:oxygen-independent coproporphyrinogen-3 oxidase